MYRPQGRGQLDLSIQSGLWRDALSCLTDVGTAWGLQGWGCCPPGTPLAEEPDKEASLHLVLHMTSCPFRAFRIFLVVSSL